MALLRHLRMTSDRVDPADPKSGSLQGVLPRLWNGMVPLVADAQSDAALQALIKMQVACRLALESLPALPAQAEHALRDPVEVLCRVLERELRPLQAQFTRGDRVV